MNKTINKISAICLSLTTAIWLSGAAMILPPVALAATTAELQAQISALLAQIQALQVQLGTAQGTTSVPTITRDLTVGSKGTDVTALQNFLISQSSAQWPSGQAATGYFGSVTQAALGKYQAAVGISPTAGYFGAKSRAYLGSLAAGTPGGTVIPPVGAPMSISIASNSPLSSSLASGAVNASVAKLNFTAGATAVVVTGLTLTRSGLSQDSDLSNVYLYDGATRLASNLGFNNGRVNFSNSTGLFTVPANSTKTITVTVDVVSTATAGRILVFGIAAATDVVGGTFSGNFPVNGAQFTTASVSNLGQMKISGNSTSSITVNAGQLNYLAGQFTVQASNNPIKVTYLRFTNVGTVTPNYLQNLKLYSGSTQLGATVSALGNDNILTFDLSSAPLMLTSGQSVVLSLYTDVTGGVNRTFQFSLQQSSDMQGVDTMYGVGIGAVNSSGLTTNLFPFQLYSATINQGGIVASKDAGTPSTYAVAGNTNQIFAKFDLLASGDSIRFNELDFTYAGGSPISNFRVVDDQGVQIGTTATTVNPGGTYQAGIGSLNYIIPANATRVLTVYGDLASTATSTVTITMGGGGTSAQSYTTLNTATFSSVGANQLTVLSAGTNLAAALNYGLGAPVNAAAGSANLKIASFVLTAGQVNAVNLTGVTLTATSSIGIMGFVRNLRVMIGSTQIGSIMSTVTQGSANTFNSGAPITINSNSNVIVDVFADISSSVTASSSAVVSLTAVNASTAAGTAVSLPLTVVGQSVSFNNGGALTGTLAGATPAASFLGMGLTGVTLATYQFNANNAGSATVTALNIYDAATTTTLYDGANVSSTLVAAKKAGDTASFYNYRLVDGVNTVSTANVDSTGLLAFNLAGVPVAMSNYKTLSLVADANAFPYASSSGAHAYQMTGFNYTNSAGSVTATSSVSGNVFTVYRTNLTVAKGAGAFTNPPSISGVGTIVGQYDFAASLGYDALVKTVVMSNSGALIQSSTTIFLGVYDLAAPSVLLSNTASTTLTGTGTSIFTMTPTAGWNIPAGTTKTLLVKVVGAPANLVVVTGGAGSYQTQISNVTWNDSQVDVSTLSPSIATPIGGQTITGLTN